VIKQKYSLLHSQLGQQLRKSIEQVIGQELNLDLYTRKEQDDYVDCIQLNSPSSILQDHHQIKKKEQVNLFYGRSSQNSTYIHGQKQMTIFNTMTIPLSLWVGYEKTRGNGLKRLKENTYKGHYGLWR